MLQIRKHHIGGAPAAASTRQSCGARERGGWIHMEHAEQGASGCARSASLALQRCECCPCGRVLAVPVGREHQGAYGEQGLPDVRAALRARCIRAAAARWNWEIESERLVKLYEELVPS